MSDLFETKTAAFSPCRTWRYHLGRTWNLNVPIATFGLLNPSTADEELDDPTIRRCISFARRFDCGGVQILNIFALRSTDPKRLKAVEDPVGPANLGYWRWALRRQEAQRGPVVVAWGNHGSFRDQDRVIMKLLQEELGRPPKCFAVTQAYQPIHPLYLPRDSDLCDYLGRDAYLNQSRRL